MRAFFLPAGAATNRKPNKSQQIEQSTANRSQSLRMRKTLKAKTEPCAVLDNVDRAFDRLRLSYALHIYVPIPQIRVSPNRDFLSVFPSLFRHEGFRSA
jgi:hypothetical protein